MCAYVNNVITEHTFLRQVLSAQYQFQLEND